MAGPARAGMFIYAKHMDRVAQFYEAVMGASRLHRTDELTVLESPDIQLVIQQIPAERGVNCIIDVPPVRRESALKFFFTVANLETASAAATRLGGGVDTEQWQGPGFIVRNGFDPEGNVFHIRGLTN